MLELTAARMTAHLNAMVARPGETAPAEPARATDRELAVEQPRAAERARAAAPIRTGAVAHHVVDPDGVLAASGGGLDSWRATELVEALPVLAKAGPSGWVLALPVPGALGVLRGPAELNRAALETTAAVVAVGGGLALLPHPVGPALQWRIHRAEAPAGPPSPYEAERALSEAVLTAARLLADIEPDRRGHGSRPDPHCDLPPGTDGQRQLMADRAARLLAGAVAALDTDGRGRGRAENGSVIPEPLADPRRRAPTSTQIEVLRTVRATAADALCAAVSQHTAGGPSVLTRSAGRVR